MKKKKKNTVKAYRGGKELKPLMEEIIIDNRETQQTPFQFDTKIDRRLTRQVLIT